MTAEAERWEAAVRDLRILCSERSESATETVENLNRFLMRGGEIRHLPFFLDIAKTFGAKP